jgi:arginyl-tRNA synthetase
VRRARAVVLEKRPTSEIDDVARQVGIGALRFAMLKSEAGASSTSAGSRR